MAGIAGALYVPQVGIINPGEFEPANSIEVVIWTAVGGRGTIIGPVIGALLVNAGKSWFTGGLPDFWLFALGGLFVVVTLFLPKGVVGLWRNTCTRRSKGQEPAPRRSNQQRRSRPMSAASKSLLYLDGVSVSFDGSARSTICRWRSQGRDARHHRPEWRRQDDDDGHHHRQDPAG